VLAVIGKLRQSGVETFAEFYLVQGVFDGGTGIFGDGYIEQLLFGQIDLVHLVAGESQAPEAVAAIQFYIIEHALYQSHIFSLYLNNFAAIHPFTSFQYRCGGTHPNSSASPLALPVAFLIL